MSKAILITRPNHDSTTDYLCCYCDEVVKMAKLKDFLVFDLKGFKAIRTDFESHMNFKKPNLVFLNGHGNELTITGHDNQPLLDSGNTNLTKGAIVYARSCEAGLKLGQMLVNSETLAFIGYKRNFVFACLSDKSTKPLEDLLAKMFLEPANLVPIVILKGHTVQVAHERSLQVMRSNFLKMMSSTASNEERYAAPWLWSNMKNQVVYGNKSAYAN